MKRERTESEEPTKRQVDFVDGILAMNRQQIILQMIQDGKLDAESGMALYEATTRPDQVEADRQAAEKGSFGPESPSGKLGTLFFKLKGHS